MSSGRSLRRVLLLLLLLGALTLVVRLPREARADGATATIAPDSGDLRTQFTLSVSGISPGHGILIALYDGAGNRFSYQKDGLDQAIVVGADGAASVQVTPASDLFGAVAGAWRVVFTEEETGYSATIPFDVAS